MLLSYSVANFKTFKLEECISFLARSYKNNKFKLINGEILPVISIYGPNGGGKTSILDSISILKEIVLSGNNFIKIVPMLKSFINNQNKKTNNNKIKWCIEFLINDFIYKYILVVDVEKGMIVEEKLSRRNKNNKREIEIFNKSLTNLKMSKDLEKTKLLLIML